MNFILVYNRNRYFQESKTRLLRNEKTIENYNFYDFTLFAEKNLLPNKNTSSVKNFRHQSKNSSLFADEFFTDEVIDFIYSHKNRSVISLQERNDRTHVLGGGDNTSVN